MKKRILFFFLLFLVGCQSRMSPAEQAAVVEKTFLEAAFEVSDQCPYVCWLGINPEITTKENVIALLRDSDQIDQTRFEISQESIGVFWILESYRDWPVYVYIELENGAVNRIFMDSTPFTMDGFFQFLGEPDQIHLHQARAPEEAYIRYYVGFSSYKLTIDVWDTDWDGPGPEDTLFGITLNRDLDSLPPAWGDPQPWIGYGHIDEYMPGLIIDLP